MAAGLYTPANATINPPRYLVADGVAIRGGFAGSEKARDERDWLENLTNLSGDIDANDHEPIASKALTSRQSKPSACMPSWPLEFEPRFSMLIPA